MIRSSCRFGQMAFLAVVGVWSLPASADDPQPTQLRPSTGVVAPSSNAPVAPPDLPPTSGITAPTPAPSAEAGAPVITPPVPVVGGQTWYGGWSGAYAPSGSYWYHVPGFNVPYAYDGYWGQMSWNGYWNYGTAYGYPGYTAYWHGWHAGPYYTDSWGWGGAGHCGHCGPYWDYAYPTWSHHGWGYSAVGWGHGHWLRHHGLSPRTAWHCGW